MNNFVEPIILKNDSSLEEKLNILKNNSFSNKDDIYKLEMGIKGEKEVEYHLKKSNIGMYIMRDINIETDDLKAQIDFVVITSHHCYFIESKNYSADIIHIDENRNFELSTKYKNKYIKRGIKSPLSQVDDQLSVFQRICLKDKTKVKELLEGVKFADFFKPIVVLTNPNSRLNNQKSPYDIKYKVLKVDNLIRQIKYDENHYRGNKLSQEQMKKIADYFMSINIKTTLDKIPQIAEYTTPITNYNKSSTKKALLKRRKSIIPFFIVMLIYALVIFDNKIYTNNATNSKKNLTINNNIISAINNLKIAYDNSNQYGFDLYNYNQCTYLKEILPNTFNCTGLPMQVKFSEGNLLSIYKNYNCYYIEYDLDNKKILKTSSKYVGYDNQCPGTDIGLINYDQSNEYLAKIGGYEKILEMARFAHNNNTGFDNYYTYEFISERGGNPSLSLTYKTKVDGYFGTMANKGTIRYDNTIDDFNMMVEYYYYIMK